MRLEGSGKEGNEHEIMALLEIAELFLRFSKEMKGLFRQSNYVLDFLTPFSKNSPTSRNEHEE